MPELFRHQHRFLGRLAVRKVSRPTDGGAASAAGGGVGTGQGATIAAPFDVLLVTHAWHDERLERCPALAADGRCSLHAEDKPLVCALAPLDALAPDASQHAVLAARSLEAAFWGAACIRAGEPDGFVPLVRRLTLVDPTARRLLAQRRAVLALEKQHWGAGVFRLLEPELFGKPEALAKIPPAGYMSLSIAPVLVVLAAVSDACRARCREYLDAQLALARKLGAPHVVRGHAALREAFASPLDRHVAEHAPDGRTAATEAWLGLEQAA